MKEPQRLSQSPEFALHEELHSVLGAEVDYDVEAGLARFQATLGAATAGLSLEGKNPLDSQSGLGEPLSLRGTASATPSAAPPAASSLLAKFALFGAGVVGIGGVLLALQNVKPQQETARRATTPSLSGEASSARVEAAGSPERRNETSPTDAPLIAVPLEALPSAIRANEPIAQRDGPKTKLVSEVASPEPTITDSELALEMRELREMRRFLASSPETALAIAAHTKFPKGSFRPERTVIMIEAYVRLGRTADAIEAAEAFLKREPSHPEVGRVRRLTGLGDNNSSAH